MRLATFQPKYKNRDNSQIAYTVFNDYLGYAPVWCFPAETVEQFRFGWWYASPSYSKYLCALETDNYKAFDLVKWNQLIQNDKAITIDDVANCFKNVNPKYAEFIVDDNELNNAVDWIEVEDAFNLVLEVLEGIIENNPNDPISPIFYKIYKETSIPQIKKKY